MAWDRPRPTVPQFPHLEIRNSDTPALCQGGLGTDLCVDFLAPADPSAWDGGITLIFQQRHRCFKEHVDLLLEVERREMLFLIFGIRGLGLWDNWGLFRLAVQLQCPFPSKGDPFPPGLLGSLWVFPAFGVKWICQE